jgi:hypothetical protein
MTVYVKTALTANNPQDLKRIAIFQLRSARFRFLFLRMSLSRNRFPLSGDML